MSAARGGWPVRCAPATNAARRRHNWRFANSHEREIERTLAFSLLDLITLPWRTERQAERLQIATLQAAQDVVTLAADTRRAWLRAVAAEQVAATHERMVEAAEAGTELARRMASVGNWSRLQLAREQAVLHERMANWAALSPQQRAQARLTFNETKSLGSDEKKTHWEAYQALSADEKKKLAAQQKSGIQGAATASQAPPPGKVIRLPGKSTPTPAPSKSSPGIVIDKKTLLPTPVAIPEGT